MGANAGCNDWIFDLHEMCSDLELMIQDSVYRVIRLAKRVSSNARERQIDNCACAFADLRATLGTAGMLLFALAPQSWIAGRMAAFQCRKGRNYRTMHCRTLGNASCAFGVMRHVELLSSSGALQSTCCLSDFMILPFLHAYGGVSDTACNLLRACGGISYTAKHFLLRRH